MSASGSISAHLKVRRDATPARSEQEIYLLDTAGETCVRLVDGLSVGMDTLYNLAINPLDEADRMLQFSVVDGELRMRARHPYVLSKDWVQVGSVRVSGGQKVVLPIGEIYFSPSFAPCAVSEEYMIEMHQIPKSQSNAGVQQGLEPKAKTEVLRQANANADKKSAVIKPAPQSQQKSKLEATTNRAETKRAKSTRTSKVVVLSLPSASKATSSPQPVRAQTNGAPTEFKALQQVAKSSYVERLQLFYWRLNREAAVLKTLGGLFGFGLGVALVVTVMQMEPVSVKVSEPTRLQDSVAAVDTAALELPAVDEAVAFDSSTPEPAPQVVAPVVEKLPDLVFQLVPPTLPRFVDRTLDEAQRLLSEGKVVWPKGHNAVELTLSALATEPDNPRAMQLLKNARYILLTVAQDSYEEGYRHDAYDLVERILAFDPGEQDVAALREKWINDRPAELRYLTRHRN